MRRVKKATAAERDLTYHCIAEWAAPNQIGMQLEYAVRAPSIHAAQREFERVKCADDRLVQIELRLPESTQIFKP